MRPYVLAETNWKTVKEIDYRVAVLPWGATEAHNYHLPYSTDVRQCDYIAAESARVAWESGAKVIVLPTIPFGINTGQLDIRLCINISPGTQTLMLRDVVQSLARQSLRKLLIFNGHGGNDFKQIIREINLDYPEMFICNLNWYQVLDGKEFFAEPGDHAGEMETSNMLYIHPGLVLPLSEAGEGAERKFKISAIREKWVWAEREWPKVTTDTGIGNPAAATAEKGREFLRMLTRKIGAFLVELAEADLDDLYE